MSSRTKPITEHWQDALRRLLRNTRSPTTRHRLLDLYVIQKRDGAWRFLNREYAPYFGELSAEFVAALEAADVFFNAQRYFYFDGNAPRGNADHWREYRRRLQTVAVIAGLDF